MCGIVGVVGDICMADKKMFDFMLKLDTVRGHHSTGVCYVKNHDRQNPIIVKNVGTPWDMILDKPNEYYLGDGKNGIGGDLAVMIGHNRWATVGEINEANAHPFRTGDIVGAQNGTLPDWWREKLDDWKDYGTDSEALFHTINNRGVKNTLSNILGAWALAWYNTKDDTFNLIRNDERPLFYAWKKNGKVLYFASQSEFIRMAADKHGVELQNDDVFYVPINTHISYKVGRVFDFGKACRTDEEVPKYVAPKFHTEIVRVKDAKDSANVFKNTPNTGTATNNVVNFPSGQSLSTSIKDWQGEIGKWHEFTVSDGLIKDEQGKTYALGCTTRGHVQIRIYPSDKRDIYKLLEEKDISTFTARIKRVKTNGKRFYLLIDTESCMAATYTSAHYRKKNEQLDVTEIMEKAKELREQPSLYDKLFGDVNEGGGFTTVVANGKPVDPKEYDRLVSRGCCWCSDTPTLGDADKLLWLNSEDFLCADCAQNEEVTQYVAQMA